MTTTGALATSFEAMVYSYRGSDGRSSMEMCRANTDGKYGKTALVARVEQDHGSTHCRAYKNHYSNKNISCVYDCEFDNRIAVVWKGAMRTDVSVSNHCGSQRTERVIQNSIQRTLARNE